MNNLNWLKSSVPEVNTISERIKMIIPRELDTNGYILREIGAKTVFVMLYTFCVNGDNWIRPATITCMDDENSKIKNEQLRSHWLNTFQGRKAPKDVPNRWYMPNTREPIRDETLRELVRLGCVLEKEGLPTTSPLPRYSLQKEFAMLFNPSLVDSELNVAIYEWQQKYLSQGALARIAISKKMVAQDNAGVLVTLPSGETRKLSPGPSSELIKAVLEKFAVKFLKKPAAILISESAKKIVMKDEELCTSIGLQIDISTVLPDIILMELGSETPLLLFIECVATDGPISERRKIDLEDIATNARYNKEDCVYVTVFKDRTDQVSRKLNPSIAWGTFIWYATEPDSIVYLHKGNERNFNYISDIHDLIR
jgi:hypothetical protein